MSVDSVWRAYVGLGANLPWQGGPPEHTLERAVDALSSLGRVEKRSSWWRTEPVGPVREQPAFVNGAVVLATALGPEALLAALLAVEQRFGRVRVGAAKGPRTLDLDLLLMERWDAGAAEWEPVVMDTPELTLPHPELARRRFALAPLAEIAPKVRHPGLGYTVRKLLEAVSGDADVERIAG